jgi:hypothetical protein
MANVMARTKLFLCASAARCVPRAGLGSGAWSSSAGCVRRSDQLRMLREVCLVALPNPTLKPTAAMLASAA